MKTKILILIFLFLSNFVPEPKADTVYLRNGRSIEGLVKKEDEERVELDVGFGTVGFIKDEVDRIEKSNLEEKRAIEREWEKKRIAERERMLKRKEALEAEKLKKEFEPKEVEFSELSDHIVVKALLNKKIEASLLLDTGATLVLLSNRIAMRLKLKFDEVKDTIIKLKMADGRKVDARYIVLDDISVEGVKAKDVGAVILVDDSDLEVDGLLGMSFLNKFNFHIDTENRKLILKKKRGLI